MTEVRELRLSYIEEAILGGLAGAVESGMPEARRIIVFGSRARGHSHENSDLDIAVILDAAVIDKNIWERLWDIKWRVLEALNAEEFPVSLMPITVRDFSGRDFGVEGAIKGEGIVIWQRPN